LVHCYAYVVLHDVNPLHFVYLLYRKALLALLLEIYTAKPMKTLRISDDAHQKLTAMLGEITAQTMKMQTYTDAIENLISTSVNLPPELLNETQTFIETNRQFGYTSREEFIRDAIRTQLRQIKEEYTCVEVPKEEYEKMQQALNDLNTEFLSVDDFVNQQIHNLLQKHQEWAKEKEEYERKKASR
jgi:Arc/MetJ-type ribon-helix-helix transcriptional regulator